MLKIYKSALYRITIYDVVRLLIRFGNITIMFTNHRTTPLRS